MAGRKMLSRFNLSLVKRQNGHFIPGMERSKNLSRMIGII